jgi:hypothetical protein
MPVLVTENVTISDKIVKKMIERYFLKANNFLTKYCPYMPSIAEIIKKLTVGFTTSYNIKKLSN